MQPAMALEHGGVSVDATEQVDPPLDLLLVHAGGQDSEEWRSIVERDRPSSVLAAPTCAFHGTRPGGDLGPT
jgi:hypothetical protein